jgi:predicted CXXCH cytochrome family protein
MKARQKELRNRRDDPGCGGQAILPVLAKSRACPDRQDCLSSITTLRRAAPLAIVVAVCLLTSAFCLAKNNSFRSTKHGDPNAGPQRRSQFARGSCVQCHDGLHAAHNGPAPQSNQRGLFAPDDNDFCFVCHNGPSSDGIFAGTGPWLQTTHAKSPAVFRPGADARPSSDANKCVNCHDPHGVKDADGLIPAMLVARDSDLCLTCHCGSRGADILADESKSYRHPIGMRNRHAPGESNPNAFAAISLNRHSECSDCHNAHRVDADPAPPFPPQASNRLAGVSRVQVSNGGAGAAPSYIWRAADDPGQANEYEICFKCHSSFTKQPPGQSNLAVLTNPANASYHPIQAPGRNTKINAAAFANGMTAQSMILCSDCHGSDDFIVRGPHGSSYRYILKKPSTTSTDQQLMQTNDICFECHVYDVYANSASLDVVQRASRFNMPATSGHAYHVGVQHVPCYGCHETHGSARHAALIATRFPGITTYSQTATGGTCTTSCHAVRTYTVTYPR